MAVSLRDEVQGVCFSDTRLDERFGLIVERLGEQPSLSIPAATKNPAELKGAYRFFANAKVSPQRILHAHYKATRQRVAQEQFVLFVQDTTEVDLTRPNQQVVGAGPMDHETRRGAFLHPLSTFTLDGLPLGTVWHKLWARDKIETTLTKKEKKKIQSQTPIEEKESVRWVEGIRATREVAKECPKTTCVCVGDSEADIYEVFSEPLEVDGAEGPIHLLVRACQKRSTDDRSNWLEKVRATECLYECTVDVSARKAKIAPEKQGKRSKSRVARIATVEVRATSVTLRAPYRPDRKLPDVKVNVVLVEEPNPPEDSDAIQWLLVTTLPIEEPEQVQRIVRAYCVRWQIEIFFRTIKTGCRIERRLFETLRRLENCTAVYMIVAWRIMYLCRLGRTCPDMDCEIVFEPCEWKAVYQIVKGEAPPETPPTLNEMIRMIASLGGYVSRKNTNPGPQTLWIGLQRAHDLSTAWNEFQKHL